MKFSSPQSPISSTSFPHRRRHHRRFQSISQENSYEEEEEIQSTESPYSQTEDAFEDEEVQGDDAEDEYEEQSRSITNDPSESIAKTSQSSNAIEASVNTAPFAQIPQPNSYINIAPLPIFQGRRGECPVAHLSRFARVCRANNAWSTEMMMRIFPVTLDGEAALWYELNVEPDVSVSWEQIKSAFVEMYRPTEFVDQLRSELLMIRQGDSEPVNAYYLRMQWILKKWPDHGIPDVMLRGIFVDGLKEDYQDWVIPHKPNSLEEALKLALTWEQAESIRAARRQKAPVLVNRCNAVKCGFFDGPHEEQTCDIRRKMKELWMKSKDKSLISVANFGVQKNFRSLSAMTSVGQRQGEAEKEGALLGWKKSQCQCWKHQCWKKTESSKSLLAGNSTGD